MKNFKEVLTEMLLDEGKLENLKNELEILRDQRKKLMDK